MKRKARSRPKQSGKARVRALVDERLQQGANGAYEASQLLRSQAQRAINTGDADKALELATEGSIALLMEGHADSGCEVALQLVEVVDTLHAQLPYDRSLEHVLTVAAAFADGAAAASPEHQRFEKAALKWSADKGPFPLGEPRLHQLIAAVEWEAGEFDAAVKHHALAETPADLARALVAHVKKASDRDALLARAVLQLLAVENLRDANALLTSYKAATEAITGNRPFLEFCSLLVRTCEYDAASLFEDLVSRFFPLLQRDPQSEGLLRIIGKKLFGIQPPPSMMDSILGMLAP